MRPPPPSATTESPPDHFSGNELDTWDFESSESSSEIDPPQWPEPLTQNTQPRPVPAPPADETWDPLEGWDPNAPLDTSAPVGSPVIPPPSAPQPAIPQPVGGPTAGTPPPPTTESLHHDRTGASAIGSVVGSGDDIPPVAQPQNQPPQPAIAANSPTFIADGADGAIDTDRVITMAVFGGLALLVFLVLLMAIF